MFGWVRVNPGIFAVSKGTYIQTMDIIYVGLNSHNFYMCLSKEAIFLSLHTAEHASMMHRMSENAPESLWHLVTMFFWIISTKDFDSDD